MHIEADIIIQVFIHKREENVKSYSIVIKDQKTAGILAVCHKNNPVTDFADRHIFGFPVFFNTIDNKVCGNACLFENKPVASLVAAAAIEENMVTLILRGENKGTVHPLVFVPLDLGEQRRKDKKRNCQ